MEFGMKMISLAVFLMSAVSMTSGQTCVSIMNCQYDMKTFADAQSQGDIPTICNLLGESVQCLEIALADCRKNANLPPNVLAQAEKGLEANKLQVQTFCPGSSESQPGETDHDQPKVVQPDAEPDMSMMGDIKCQDLMKCMFDINKFQVAINESRLKEACGIINPSVKCLRSAIADCRDAMSQEDSVKAMQTLTESETLLKQFCGYKSESTDGGSNMDSGDSKSGTGMNDGTNKGDASYTNVNTHSAEGEQIVSSDNNNNNNNSGGDGNSSPHSLASLPLLFIITVFSWLLH